LDPSLFTSVDRLKDARRVLEALRKGSLRIVLPSSLFDDFKALLMGKNPEHLHEIYKAWLPLYPRDHIEAIVKQQSIDRIYLNNLDALFKDYSPIAARDYVENMERVGEKSVWRERVQQKLGPVVGRIAFELIAVSYRLSAWVIGFGRRVYTFLSRVGIKVHESKSRLKKEIKKHSKIRRTLRIAGYAIASDTAKALMVSLGLPPIPLSRDIGLGMILVADG